MSDLFFIFAQRKFFFFSQKGNILTLWVFCLFCKYKHYKGLHGKLVKLDTSYHS